MLYLNGGIEETGLAGGVMGHPAHGIRWVCKRFAPHGIGLELLSSFWPGRSHVRSRSNPATTSGRTTVRSGTSR